MASEYPLLITLGALLILSPFVKSLMERIGALFAGLAFSRDPQAVHTDAQSYFL